MNKLVNTVMDTVPELTVEQAFKLGMSITNLEHEADTVVRDFSSLQTAIDNTSELSLIDSTTEAYKVAMSSIATSANIDTVTLLNLTTEAKTDARHAIELILKVYQAFFKKISAVLKKLFIKVVAWLATSDKKRDTLITTIKELKLTQFSNEHYEKLVPIFRLREANLLGYENPSLEASRFDDRTRALKKSLMSVIGDIHQEDDIFKENKEISKAMRSTLVSWDFKGEIPDHLREALVYKYVHVTLINIYNNKIDFLVDCYNVNETDDTKQKNQYYTKKITVELKDSTDEEIAKTIVSNGFRTPNNVLSMLNSLPDAKKLQEFISKGFDSMGDLRKISGEVPGVKEKTDAETSNVYATGELNRITAYTTTAYLESKNAISLYRQIMKLGTAVSEFKEVDRSNQKALPAPKKK